jgi:hypothetical protein
MKYDLKNTYDLNKARLLFDKYISEGKRIELSLVKEKRTINQNNYIHVLFTLFGIEFGLTIDEAKTYIKRHCPFMTYEKNGEKYLRSTADLSITEMITFVDWFRHYASMHGCHLPSSEEYLLKRFDIDRTIEAHKEYL